jgi:hypothetical protein
MSKIKVSWFRDRNYLGWIKTAAEGKSGRGRHGKGYELLISVEDWWFDTERDMPEVMSFTKQEVLGLPLEFAALHLVGLTGNLFLSFPLLAGDRPL